MINNLTSALSFTIPTGEAVKYSGSVSAEDMRDCRLLLATLERIHSANKILPACKQLSIQLQGRWSPHHLRTKYYQFAKYGDPDRGYQPGDWRVCLNKAKARIDRADIDTSVARRQAFVEFWRKLGEEFHQDWAAAHDELLHIWRTGYRKLSMPQGQKFTTLPGYAEWPKADEWLGHPAGWSYANLMRYQSDPYDQAAARIGHAKASEHRLPVLTTRVGLDFGRYLEFDDHEFNQRVLFQKKPMRPLGFGVVEVLSACVCHVGLKPTLWDFEEEVKRKLTEREFMWFVVSVLTSIGYRADIGTTLIGERGTSRLTPEFIGRLLRITCGKVDWFVGGRFGKPAHAGQFEGRSKGNFRTKKLIEGSWALIDNQTAALPAQTGRSRLDAPEGFAPQAGAEQYTLRTIRQADAAGVAVDSLRFPYPFYWQWQQWALDAFKQINTDPNHDIEGWEKLGFVQPVWRLPSIDATTGATWLPWQKLLALPPAEQAAVKALIETDASLVKTHRLSRQAVFDAHRKQLTPLAWELLPELVGEENALSEPLTIRQGLFRFECQDIDPDPIEFYARDYRSASFLSNGDKYLCFVNPYAPTHLVACEKSGDSLRVKAVCQRYVRACRSDEDAVKRLMGDQQSFEAQARVRLNLRHADQAAAKQSLIEHNARALNVPRETPQVVPTPNADCTQDLLSRESAAPAGETDSWT